MTESRVVLNEFMKDGFVLVRYGFELARYGFKLLGKVWNECD